MMKIMTMILLGRRTILVANVSIIFATMFHVEMKMTNATYGGAANVKKITVCHVSLDQSAMVVVYFPVTNVK